jgi:hypothetical protein
MPQPQDNLAHQLRSAVLAGHHEDATRLTLEYTAAVQRHWSTLPDREKAASPIPKQSLELLNWVRDMALIQQAMAAQHLAVVEQAARYQTARALYLGSAALSAQR